MKRVRLLTILAVPALLLTTVSGLVYAQGTGPRAGRQALIGTAFTYQGLLTQDGSPVDDTCDFQFGLWDDGGVQIGPILELLDEPVADGRFTVVLDFGAVFNGTAPWLEVAVRCGDETAYTTLTPRQPLTAAPYALALPGLWTQPNATSPNVIGGCRSNVVGDGLVGVTISGGGDDLYPQQVNGNYATVGGGRGNHAVDSATVGGGDGNTASGEGSTVGGGTENIASSYMATIGGGTENTASGNYATVGGGDSNSASDEAVTVGGGQFNTATGYAATVAGGWGNEANGETATAGGGFYNTSDNNYTTVAGGATNSAHGYAATIGGGSNNTASGWYATVPGGLSAVATHHGEQAHASGQFANAGDAQASQYVLRREATMAPGVWHSLYLDGASALLTITPGRAVTFDILVVGRTEAGESAGYRIQGVIENVGGATALVGTPTFTVLGEDDTAWDAQTLADGTDDALLVVVQGNGELIRWVATVQTAEVSW